jgi:hypothetical protein
MSFHNVLAKEGQVFYDTQWNRQLRVTMVHGQMVKICHRHPTSLRILSLNLKSKFVEFITHIIMSTGIMSNKNSEQKRKETRQIHGAKQDSMIDYHGAISRRL